jgi:hypothetical protein
MALSRKPRARMSPKGEPRARRDMECVCSHPYRDHRQERSRIAMVCAKCRCVGFTPREQRAWDELFRQREGRGRRVLGKMDE